MGRRGPADSARPLHIGIIQKAWRSAAVALAVLFIVISLIGLFGVWFAEGSAANIAVKGFGVVETGVGVVDTGVARVHDLIAASRTEVRQAAETITVVGGRAE